MRAAATLALLAAFMTPAWAEAPDTAILTAGLTAIRERALLDLPVAKLAIEGLKGLAAIDPAIEITEEDVGNLGILYGTRRIAGVVRPADNDAAGWARAIDRVVTAVSASAPAIRQADRGRIEQTIFDSALGLLDVFSHFDNPADAKEHRAERDGFGGVGILYEPASDGLLLTSVIADTPAAKAGLRAGDRITAIDGIAVAGQRRAMIVERLHGPTESPIILTVRHASGRQTAALTLLRSLVVPPTVMMTTDKKIATIAISGFNQNTAPALREALAKIDTRNVILDLRGNPGGLLDQGIAVADQFIAQGRILATHGRHPASHRVFDAKPGDTGENLRLVVLADGRTASAAEIVTAALQDSGRAVVIGTNTFGKGTVQTVVRLADDAELTLTWARFFTPSGYALHGLGVLPNLCTSGAANPNILLKALGAEKPGPAPQFEQWRTVAVDDHERRQKLRGRCPAEDHAVRTVETALARRLLDAPELYERALAQSAPPQ